jgi:hypothetical protein
VIYTSSASAIRTVIAVSKKCKFQTQLPLRLVLSFRPKNKKIKSLVGSYIILLPDTCYSYGTAAIRNAVLNYETRPQRQPTGHQRWWLVARRISTANVWASGQLIWKTTLENSLMQQFDQGSFQKCTSSSPGPRPLISI